MSETPVTPQEIIIVRRSNGDGDGGHHGGAWKIAYADFVTAMMAFFLVMWLINSANEVTKSRVASYFNPIKMTDASPSGRGVKDPIERKSIEPPKEKGKEPKSMNEAANSEAADKEADEKLLQNPYSAIEEIVARGSIGPADSPQNMANRSTGDPFDPRAWEALRNGKAPEAKTIGPPSESQNNPQHAAKTAEVADVEKPDAEKVPPLRPSQDVHELEQAVKTEEGQTTNAETAKLEDAVKRIVEKYKAEMDVSVVVRRTNEGLLVMLGDNNGQGMFGIGSAKPSVGLIEIVGVIGKLLSEQSGEVIIRGHTDNRKYKTSRYDNWQLSTARAHMASYMLIRGGLDEKRIKRIEGHGSATPLLASDPLSDSNRRVEFLLVAESKAQ